ncbi:uncharacterized protein [Clytia hemisphaerica]|uniref:Fibronectin type-III domain-containing protein n=1 Tax=Clytia hemisphaerica TaxID=252671 RepID=A0A7M5X5D1_9CNID
MMLKISVALFALVSFAACAWPGGQRVIDSNARGFTVIHDEADNSNNETLYAFSYEIANKPSYFYSQGFLSTGHSSPNLTLSGLRINEIISFKVCNYQLGTTITNDLFSSATDISVKRSELAGNTLVPGIPLNLKVIAGSSNKFHSATVTWDNPQNIQDSTNETDKSIQYKFEICRYNRFTEMKSKCEIEADILRNKASTTQSTEQTKSSKLYDFNFHPSKSDELVYRITGIALNGTAGPTAEAIARLNSTLAPKAPYNVTVALHTEIYADTLTLSWLSADQGVNYVRYNIKGNSTTMMKSGSSPMVISGLRNSTEYEFQVGVYTERNGGSEYSVKYTASTTNEPRPTPKPGNNGTMLTSSLFLLLSSLFAVIKFL